MRYTYHDWFLDNCKCQDQELKNEIAVKIETIKPQVEEIKEEIKDAVKVENNIAIEKPMNIVEEDSSEAPLSDLNEHHSTAQPQKEVNTSYKTTTYKYKAK